MRRRDVMGLAFCVSPLEFHENYKLLRTVSLEDLR